MAKVTGGIIAKQQNNQVQQQNKAIGLSAMISMKSVQDRFEKMLGKKSAGFLSSLLSLTNDNKLLANADPRTVLAAAATAASLDLPINPSLGKAYIVPYKGSAQFQLGYRGLIDLAQRSGQMRFITMTEVYEGEITDWNRFTETYTAGERTSDAVVGYFASFELINGFRKSTYWTKEEVTKHAQKYSKSFNYSTSAWQTDFNRMACKTVLISILKTYAPMSIEMQMAVENDNGIKTMDVANGDIEDVAIDVDTVETVEETEQKQDVVQDNSEQELTFE